MALLIDFLWLLFFVKHVVVFINSAIKMKVCFITKLNVIELAMSFLKLFQASCTSRFSSVDSVAAARGVGILNGHSFRSFLMPLNIVVGDEVIA